MKKNVLITACGAKVALVRAFRKATQQLGGKVLASDLSPHAVALYDADAAVYLPPWSNPGYMDAFLDVCHQHEIALVVPTADAEMRWLLPVAEVLRAEGVQVLLPAAETLAICRDKAAFNRFCVAHGFPVPRAFEADSDPQQFPLFIRPRAGQGSAGSWRVDSPGQLAAVRAWGGDLVIQEYIADPEYSVDLLMDLTPGVALQAVARRRVDIRGGEACTSRVENIGTLTDTALRLGKALGLVGHNVVQAFYSPEQGVRLIEVNPRFGGASSLSIEAGLDSPRRLLQLVAGDASARAPHNIQYGLTLLRYGEDRFVAAEGSA